MKEIDITAVVENLQTVLDFVDEQLEEKDCPLKIKMQIDMAVEEIFVNISNYAYFPDVCLTIRLKERIRTFLSLRNKGG